MSKIFYTARDIEDLSANGVSTLVVSDDVVVTDLGRERADKLGLELVREHDQPSSAPVRPYITEKVSPSAAPSLPEPPAAPPPPASLEERVYQAVQEKTDDSVDPQLLKTIISRVMKNIQGN